MCCLDFADIAFLVMVFSSSVIVSAKTIIVGNYTLLDPDIGNISE